MQMLGAFAEFERAMIRERTREGLKSAAAAGRIGGRRPKLRADQKAEAIRGVAEGRRAADYARLFNVSRSTVSRAVRRHKFTLEHVRKKSLNICRTALCAKRPRPLRKHGGVFYAATFRGRPRAARALNIPSANFRNAPSGLRSTAQPSDRHLPCQRSMTS